MFISGSTEAIRESLLLVEFPNNSSRKSLQSLLIIKVDTAKKKM